MDRHLLAKSDVAISRSREICLDCQPYRTATPELNRADDQRHHLGEGAVLLRPGPCSQVAHPRFFAAKQDQWRVLWGCDGAIGQSLSAAPQRIAEGLKDGFCRDETCLRLVRLTGRQRQRYEVPGDGDGSVVLPHWKCNFSPWRYRQHVWGNKTRR